MSWVPFGVLGLKIRLASGAGAVMFIAWVLGNETVARLWPGAPLYVWLSIAVVAAGLFYRVRRTNDEGELDLAFLNALIPWPLWIPGFIWGLAAEDGPPTFGYWPVLGAVWTGAGLYAVLLGAAITYNLLRLNLLKTFRRR